MTAFENFSKLAAHGPDIEQNNYSLYVNIGGGAAFTVSILNEMEPVLSKLAGRSISVKHHDWRPGDQKVYISDITLFENYGWNPKVNPMNGVRMLWDWVNNNLSLVSQI